jgi:hypothetical protein
LVDFVEQVFEALVFGKPYPDLREPVFRDLDGPRLATFLEGQVLTGMQRAAVVAAAGQAATAMGIGPERGSEDRGSRPEFLEAMLEHAEDQGRVVGNAHGSSGTGRSDCQA